MDLPGVIGQRGVVWSSCGGSVVSSRSTGGFKLGIRRLGPSSSQYIQGEVLERASCSNELMSGV